MNDWIFLSKNNQDEYINMFARGCGAIPVDSIKYRESQNPIVLRGILKHKIMKQCWKDNRTFYYMDTGYFGNEKTQSNPNGWKYWHRIVKNNIQHDKIIKRPPDRFQQFGKKFQFWKKTGRNIMIAKPDEKPCKFYNINLEEWVDNVIKTLKLYTDRPIIIRERSPLRKDRITNDTLETALEKNDVYALVTFNSVAAIESIFCGYPAFTLAPTHAASPVSSQDLSLIETPCYPDSDQLFEWACHLAYGQFHVDELRSGKAKFLLEEWFNES